MSSFNDSTYKIAKECELDLQRAIHRGGMVGADHVIRYLWTVANASKQACIERLRQEASKYRMDAAAIHVPYAYSHQMGERGDLDRKAEALEDAARVLNEFNLRDA